MTTSGTPKKTVENEPSQASNKEMGAVIQFDENMLKDQRRGARRLIAERAVDPELREAMRRALKEHAPVMPTEFRTPAKVSKFKRSQREFDQLLKELNLTDAEELQQQNSLVRGPQSVHRSTLSG